MKRAAACFLAMIVVTGCSPEKKPAVQEPQGVSGIRVARVESVQIPEYLEAVGTVRARSAATIAARIPGTVLTVRAREGERVERGALLVRLEAAEPRAAAAAAAAGVEEARRGVEEAAARNSLAEATYERYRRLFEQEAVTRQEYDTRTTECQVAAKGLARAEARLRQAQEGAASAQAAAGYTAVTSPLSGVVTRRSVDPGMTVFPGTPLLVVEAEGGYRLEANAPETLLGTLKPGSRVEVALEGAAAPLAATVSEVVPAVDPVSRTFVVKADLKGGPFRSGAFGKARFAVGARGALLVPAGAVVQRGALTSLWVIEANVAKLRLVKTGGVIGDSVEILSGLTAGELVAVSGVERLADGITVR